MERQIEELIKRIDENQNKIVELVTQLNEMQCKIDSAIKRIDKLFLADEAFEVESLNVRVKF